ncbi:MAG: MMPL family transporter [Streptosporangiaceae bacterium]
MTFTVAGNPAPAVPAAQQAVAAVGPRHPGLRIEETGHASVNEAINTSVSRDFRRAEVTSVPITLILLLLVFGALVAAGIPLLLAGTAVASAISLLAIPSRWLPGQLHHIFGGAAGRDGGRRRLLAVLPAPRTQRNAPLGGPSATRCGSPRRPPAAPSSCPG